MAIRRDIDRLQDELEQLFEDLWQGPRFARQRPGFRPAVDGYLTEDPPELTIVIELAGVDPKGIHLVVMSQLLVISGHRTRPGPKPKCRPSWYQMEIPHGPFERRVRLPENARPDGARATYARGLLTIVLPLASEPAPAEAVSIPVKTAR